MRKGLALIELILAMALAGLVFILVSSILVTLTTSNLRSRIRDNMDKVKKDLFVEFQEKIKWTEGNTYLKNEPIDVTHTCEVDLCVGKYDESDIFLGSKYKLESGVLKRDESPITPENILVTGFGIEKRGQVGGDPNKFAFEITFGFVDSKNNLLTDAIKIPVSGRILVTQ